jgi:hypothetical protein
LFCVVGCGTEANAVECCMVLPPLKGTSWAACAHRKLVKHNGPSSAVTAITHLSSISSVNKLYQVGAGRGVMHLLFLQVQ